MRKLFTLIGVAVAVIGFVGVASLLFFVESHPDGGRANDAAADKFQIGDEVQISRPGTTDRFPLIDTETNFARLKDAGVSRESGVLKDLRQGGHIEIVPNGLRGIVLDRRPGMIKVRMLSLIPTEALVGWVDDAYVEGVGGSAFDMAPDPSTLASIPEPLPSNPEAKAALESARAARVEGNEKSAIRTLRRLIKAHPGTAEAREAEKQLREMGAKPCSRSSPSAGS